MKRFIAILMTLIMMLGLSSVGVWADDEATWQEETPMRIARSEAVAASVGKNIYVFSGYGNESYDYQWLSSFEIYDSETKTWTGSRAMPEAMSEFSVSVDGDKIYLFGGGGPNKTGACTTVRIYDTSINKWSEGTAMPTKRTGHASVSVGSKIYVLSGVAPWTALTSVDIYDTETDTWSSGTDMPVSRRDFSASLVGKNIYIIGGGSSDVGIYNTQTNTWTTGQPIPASSSDNYSQAQVVGHNIYATAGDSVLIYNVDTDTWSAGLSVNVVRTNMTMATVDNVIYTIGGNSSSPVATVESLRVASSAQIPGATTSLTAAGGDSKADLSWDSVSDANYYNVKRSTTTGGIYTTIASTSAITYTDSDVTNEITYYYVVSAVNDEGESADSNQASATPQATATPEYVLAILLNVDETVQLSVTYDLADNTNLTWTSSDGAIAIVDGNGKVTAISEGLTYIYAENEDGNFKEFIPVKVVLGDADEMRLAVHLTAGEKALLYLTDDPSDVTWSSMDTSIATISAEGEITAVSKGLVIIQAELEGSIYQVYVRVNA